MSYGLDLPAWVGKVSMPCHDPHAITHYRVQVDLVIFDQLFDQKVFHDSKALDVYRLSLVLKERLRQLKMQAIST